MGIFDYLRPRRQNGIPRKNTMPPNSPDILSYQNDALDKRHSKVSSMSPNAEQPQADTRPTTSSSWTSILTSTTTSTSISISTSTFVLTPTTTSHTTTPTPLSPPHSIDTLSNHDLNVNRPPTPPSRHPPPPSPPPSPPLFPTSEFTLHLPPPPPPYARHSSRRTDLPLPSYAELVQERQIVPPRPRPLPTPREPPPSFEAAEIEEHEELHGIDPSSWPGCEYCRVYELWVFYWRGAGGGR
ncbi:hypothetical protein B0T13DRAFT_92372 [Neurospora crassa]|nr:hypothetical protein B0T13DRAFT_92372 [Neurospora crassa]